jgi:transposase-like protein
VGPQDRRIHCRDRREAVIQGAYANGVSTRGVDYLVTQSGLTGMSRNAVGRLRCGWDQQVRIFRERPLKGACPASGWGTKRERVREPDGERHKALVVTYGVHKTGRGVLGPALTRDRGLLAEIPTQPARPRTHRHPAWRPDATRVKERDRQDARPGSAARALPA